MWQKLTWMLFGQNSTWAVLRKAVRALIYQWKYAECFIWNFIKPPPSLSFPLSGPHPRSTSTFKHTHQRRQKSLWAWPVPSVNDILFTNTLEQCRGGHGRSHPHTRSVWALYLIPLFKRPLIQMKRSIWLNTQNGCSCAWQRRAATTGAGSV